MAVIIPFNAIQVQIPTVSFHVDLVGGKEVHWLSTGERGFPGMALQADKGGGGSPTLDYHQKHHSKRDMSEYFRVNINLVE